MLNPPYLAAKRVARVNRQPVKFHASTHQDPCEPYPAEYGYMGVGVLKQLADQNVSRDGLIAGNVDAERRGNDPLVSGLARKRLEGNGLRRVPVTSRKGQACPAGNGHRGGAVDNGRLNRDVLARLAGKLNRKGSGAAVPDSQPGGRADYKRLRRAVLITDNGSGGNRRKVLLRQKEFLRIWGRGYCRKGTPGPLAY
jgi:hypothetical protein